MPSPADHPEPEIELCSPALQADPLPTELSGKPPTHIHVYYYPCFQSSLEGAWNVSPTDKGE